MSKEKNFVSAVIYVHNAEARIKEFLKNVISVLEDNFEHSEIICVNDYSDDNSVGVIKEVAKNAKNTCVSVLNMSYFHGLEMSMNAGLDLAIGDFVFEFDTTVMDYNSEEIIKVYKHALSGYDIVSASPDKKQALSSRVFYSVFHRFGSLSYKMTTESFRVLSRRVINRIDNMNKTVMYRKAVYANCGLKTDNIVYNSISSEKVSDKYERKYRRKLAMDSLILFTDVGYKFSTMMTFLMMLMTGFMVCYSLLVYFMGNPVEGWTTTILFLSVVFFGLFGILTIIIKYLQLIIEQVFKRKKYSFESIEKITK